MFTISDTGTFQMGNSGTLTYTANRFAYVDNTSIDYWKQVEGTGFIWPVTASGQRANVVVAETKTYVGFANIRAYVSGIVYVEMGTSTILCGDPVATDANGKAIPAGANDYVVGYALEEINTSYKLLYRNTIAIQLNTLNEGTDNRGHFRPQGTGITVLANGINQGQTINGNSTRGTVTMSSGSLAASGVTFNHTFANAYATSPYVLVTALNAATATATPYVKTVTTTGFDVGFLGSSTGVNLSYNYMVIA
jgi:hypothetical protein